MEFEEQPFIKIYCLILKGIREYEQLGKMEKFLKRRT